MSDYLRSRRRVLQTAGATIGGGLATGIGGADGDGRDEDAVLEDLPTTFSATLTDAVVPYEVETNACGTAAFEIDLEARAVHYAIDVEWLCDPIAVRIRSGNDDGEGRGLVQLYPRAGTADRIEGRFDGTLAEGTLTLEDLLGAFDRSDLEAIATELAEGEVYVSVATESYPTGELRGRIVCEDDRESGDGDGSEDETREGDSTEETTDEASGDAEQDATDEASENDSGRDTADETPEGDTEQDPADEAAEENSKEGSDDESSETDRSGETVYGAPEDPDDE
ncbi:CHRD domain-containing protein [Natronococcus jeotgali]|uniref:CHRD domain-containing protein n=1 Tax=Natronococcus jeotgali TaxID=413812 RepID=UPI00067810C2|nr:CHRD domain-containing protein [Natronococcus jeotgali]